MSQVSSKVARAGLAGVVGLAAAIAAAQMVGHHRAAPDSPLAAQDGTVLQNGFGHLHLAPAVSYANLTVYPVYGDAPAPVRPVPAEYVTLAEGMDKGSVTARESDAACVGGDGSAPETPSGVTVPDDSVTNAEQGREHRDANLLLVTNTAPQPTYVPDGQVVPGGGQDRGAASDTIVPARSAQVGVAAFCVERHRSEGPSADFRKNVVLAIPLGPLRHAGRRRAAAGLGRGRDSHAALRGGDADRDLRGPDPEPCRTAGRPALHGCFDRPDPGGDAGPGHRRGRGHQWPDRLHRPV